MTTKTFTKKTYPGLANDPVAQRIKETTAYQTTDGERHDSLGEAYRHQIEVDFEQWYHADNNELFGDTRSVEFKTVATWLSEHRDVVLQYLNALGATGIK